MPAPAAGRLSQIAKKAGEPAEVGEVIGYMEAGEGAVEEPPAPAEPKHERPPAEQVEQAPQPAEQPQAEQPPQPPRPGEPPQPPQQPKQPSSPPPAAEPRVMPAAQRELQQRGIPAGDVQGTGPGGRVLKEDVIRHSDQAARTGHTRRTEAAPPEPAETPPEVRDEPPQAREPGQPREVPPPSPSAPAPEAPPTAREQDVVPMTPMRKRIAERLVQAQQSAALLTTFNEIDMSAVMSLRQQYREGFEKKYGIKLGFMSFFVKASVEALKQFPRVNAEVRGTDIVYHNYYDIGIAVSGGKGLVVPVLRSAERMSFAQIETTIADFASRARDNKINLDELAGGTFTITNGGVFGSLLSTPIVNPPQSAILGLHAIQDRPVAREGQVVIRPMMYAALTYDHCLVDGREAVTFLRRIKEVIEEPSRMLIEI